VTVKGAHLACDARETTWWCQWSRTQRGWQRVACTSSRRAPQATPRLAKRVRKTNNGVRRAQRDQSASSAIAACALAAGLECTKTWQERRAAERVLKIRLIQIRMQKTTPAAGSSKSEQKVASLRPLVHRIY